MACLPIPYPDELLYSVIGRYGVHTLTTSPKQLLDDVFQNRQIVASVAFQGHLGKISSHYQGNPKLTPYKLLQKHTLYPLYAPFVHPEKAYLSKQALLKDEPHSTDVQLGKAASCVKSPVYLRYCPNCVSEQINRYGEAFWQRGLQIPGISVCPKHACILLNSNVQISGLHKHEFIALNPSSLQSGVIQYGSSKQLSLATNAVRFLELKALKIYPEQWTLFYKKLASEHGYNHGEHIDHDRVLEQVESYWQSNFLEQLGLKVDACKDTNWLRSIFRKHRKSFSYLQHLLVWQAFFGNGLNIEAVLRKASNQSLDKSPESYDSAQEVVIDKNKRALWLTSATKLGIKKARLLGFGSLYAWLYRHDKKWLLDTNSKLGLPTVSINKRVNWKARDLCYVKRFISLRNQTEMHLESEHFSKNWYFINADISLSQIKHIDKLPLCKLFLAKYCETIEEYQCRRIAVACIKSERNHHDLRKWRILRFARLSKDRICPLAAELLGYVVAYDSS
ncbi:transposase [Pseudoalteromonas phenolica]|uniref:Transposase n=1 Tax=Pseudoalteromonas phenolica TaxID=161398 RepID=A0A5S3YUI0_9GAMM|nr:TnsD family Tn7-like transposition protein [Pseudoalteromonas phenolica]TMP80580.1 transposase [Pseudoalteromonas phenolica]